MLDEIEQSWFAVRNNVVTVFRVQGRWICASLDRGYAVARVWMLEPKGDQGWTLLMDQFADDEEYCWRTPLVAGLNKNLTYEEAEQAAYIFLSEGEFEFDFHEGVALRIDWNFGQTHIDVAISTRYDIRRGVMIAERDGGWVAYGRFEVWNPEIRCFEAERQGPQFPASGVGNFEAVRQVAYNWLVEPALNESQNMQAAA